MGHRTTTQLHASFYINKTKSQGVVSMAKKGSGTYKVGRDAKTGQFIPVKTAERRKSTAVVETMKKKK